MFGAQLAALKKPRAASPCAGRVALIHREGREEGDIGQARLTVLPHQVHTQATRHE